MTKRIRTTIVALVGALGLLVAPIALAAPAAAAMVSNVLFFSNDDWTDPDQEDATQIAGLVAAGATVTTFDGGDGSAAAWAAQIAGKQVVVFPEFDSGIVGSDVLSVEALDVIADFVSAGGVLFLPSEYSDGIITDLTGVDFSTGWVNSGGSGPWPYSGEENPAFPESLGYSDGTYPVGVGTWGPDQFDASFPLYYDGEADEFVVAGFPVGEGVIYVFAYDWYPGVEGDDEANRAEWNIVMGLLLPFIEVPDPVQPQLAATGSSVDAGVLIAGALLLLVAGVAIIATPRRKASA